MIRKIFPILVVVFGLLIVAVILFVTVVFYRIGTREHKKSIFAGYAAASIIDYRLEVFEDSTYYLSTLNSVDGRWFYDNDTLKLRYNGGIGASIYKGKVVNYKPVFYSLRRMEFKKFTPAKVVDF